MAYCCGPTRVRLVGTAGGDWWHTHQYHFLKLSLPVDGGRNQAARVDHNSSKSSTLHGPCGHRVGTRFAASIAWPCRQCCVVVFLRLPPPHYQPSPAYVPSLSSRDLLGLPRVASSESWARPTYDISSSQHARRFDVTLRSTKERVRSIVNAE